jgi:hypothetical protein
MYGRRVIGKICLDAHAGVLYEFVFDAIIDLQADPIPTFPEKVTATHAQVTWSFLKPNQK